MIDVTANRGGGIARELHCVVRIVLHIIRNRLACSSAATEDPAGGCVTTTSLYHHFFRTIDISVWIAPR